VVGDVCGLSGSEAQAVPAEIKIGPRRDPISLASVAPSSRNFAGSLRSVQLSAQSAVSIAPASAPRPRLVVDRILEVIQVCSTLPNGNCGVSLIMKKSLLIMAGLFASLQLHGQGTVWLSNVNLNAPVLNSLTLDNDGTPLRAVAGTTFSVALYWSPYGLTSLTAPDQPFTQVGQSVHLGFPPPAPPGSGAGEYRGGRRHRTWRRPSRRLRLVPSQSMGDRLWHFLRAGGCGWADERENCAAWGQQQRSSANRKLRHHAYNSGLPDWNIAHTFNGRAGAVRHRVGRVECLRSSLIPVEETYSSAVTRPALGRSRSTSGAPRWR
jgi:hypothetical protein